MLCCESHVQCSGSQENSNNSADVGEEILHAVMETEL